MTVNSLGPLSQLQNYTKTDKSAKTSYQAEKDTISISKEARSMAESYKIAKEIENTPDIRLERIEEIKKKINDPSYINDTVVNATADKIMDMFGI